MASKGLLLFTALLIVSGCSKSFIQEEWQCPLVQGEGCLSISQADAMVGVAAVKGEKAGPAPAVDTVALPPPGATGGGGGSAPVPGRQLRSPEKLARIWVAPFIDADDILHEAGFIHVVVEPAGWAGLADDPPAGRESPGGVGQ